MECMRVLSVDLATSYENIGIVVLEENQDAFCVRVLPAQDLNLKGPPSPQDLATKLVDACRCLSATTWKRSAA